jgi:hypothetical protein
VQCVANLQQQITVAIATVPLNMLALVWTEVEYNYDVYRAVSGAHNELHWMTHKLDEFPQ